MLKKVAFVIVVLTLVCAVPTVAQQRDRRFDTTGQLGLVAIPVGAQLTCIGGEPTYLSFPYPPCTEGTIRIVSRGAVQTWAPADETWTPPAEPLSGPDAALLNGPITFVVNCNFDANYRGPCWGTFEWQIPGVGKWEGSVTTPVMDLVTYESVLSMVGHGSGGDLEGKQLKVDGFANPGDWYFTFTARVK